MKCGKMMSRRILTVIVDRQPVFVFDADGVAIRPWGFADRLAHEFGIHRSQTRDFFVGPFQACLVGDADLADILPRYLDAWGWPRDTAAFIELWMAADDQPDETVLSTVRTLRAGGYRCCLASNQERNRADYIEREMRFSECFDRLYFSCALGVMKPDRRYYHLIAEDLGVAPEAIHFFDDTPGHVEAARQAGWHAVTYSEPADLPAPGVN